MQTALPLRCDCQLWSTSAIAPAAPCRPCPQEPTCPRAIQLISVPPEQLRKHAQANACGVATLPVGALVLPPGLEYAHAVFLVAEAAELQWRLQAAAADVQRSGGGKAA